MAAGWLDITDGTGTRREPLRGGLTRVGGAGADVVLSAALQGVLEVREDPPRVRFEAGGRAESLAGSAPLLGGRPFEDAGLRPGDRIDWSGCTLVYGEGAGGQASLEEVSLEEAGAGAERAAARERPDGEERVWRRLAAGLALELGLADGAVARRWRDAVVRDEFDPDACAAEVLLTGNVDAGDPRLVERSGRLLRDFLMAPMLRGARGAGRRARRAVRGGVAFLVSQLVALGVLALILLAAMLLLRIRGVSFDGVLDRLLFR